MGETPLWLDGNEPGPPAAIAEEPFEPTRFDAEAVADAIAACRDSALRATLETTEPFERRAADTLFHQAYYPTRFANRPAIVPPAAREPRLSLPFRAEDFVGVSFPR